MALSPNHRPVSLFGIDKVSGVRFERDGVFHLLGADRVILALGQVPEPPPWLVAHSVALDGQSRIVVDAEGRTHHPRIYAGGDNTHGPDLVVTAMAAGRRAAEGMLADFNLRGRLRQQTRQLLLRSAAAQAPRAAREAAE